MFISDTFLFISDTISFFFCIFAPEMENDSIIKQRNKDITMAYERIVKAGAYIRNVSRSTIISLIQEQSAPRFYIAPHTAKLYLLNIHQPGTRYRQKKHMIDDLRENFYRLKQQNPGKPKEWLYENVVEMPAKSFYVSAHRIEEIIFQYSGRT